MEIEGLDYNTQREKLKLMAYGRDIQQMVDLCVTLPTKTERQKCANTIIEVMKRVVPSQMNSKERLPALWYHLALMSDFKLDIDYPVEIIHEDKMAIKPGKIEYTNKRGLGVKHYGRLLLATFAKLKEMPAGRERDALAEKTAKQMSRCLTTWGMGTADKEKIVSDMARFTDGVIQLDKDSLQLDNGQRNGTTNSAIARDSMQADYQNKKKRRKKK
ncbi:MAG: DUF4290 domain-containing protein [Prevotella sp.]|nr:DUF4290 domain-containing protein [Prevotella sp.]